MSLKDRIYADHISAFKSQDVVRKTILSVVKSSIQTQEKNSGEAELSDQEVLRLINRQVKSLKESIALANDEESRSQLEVLEQYLPKAMSREEIASEIGRLRSEGKNSIGEIMAAFSGKPADRKLVADLFKESA